MSAWPSTLPQAPLASGFSRMQRDNVISSAMDYGPAKKRNRVTSYLYDIALSLLLTQAQVETLETFYNANKTATWTWLDFGVVPYPAATYRFMAPPSTQPAGGDYFHVTLALEMEK